MSTKKRDNIADWCVRVLSSKWFLLGIILLFVLQASWIAFSNRYPLVIDEKTHFSIIEYYSHQTTPFFSQQDRSVDYYGVVARNPNIFYYGTMGYVLRIVSVLSKSLVFKVILLRLVHVLMVALGLFIVARTLRLFGLSRAQANITILLLTLLPITTFLAAHINYDNMLFLFSALFLYVAITIIQDTHKPPTNQLLIFTVIGLATCLTKFTFIPVFITAGVYIFFARILRFKKELIQDLTRKKNWNLTRYALVILVVLMSIVCIYRLIGNAVKYGNISPSCVRVLGGERCGGNFFYEREKNLINNDLGIRMSAVDYGNLWQSEMFKGLFFYAAYDKDGSWIGTSIPAFLSTVLLLASIAGCFVVAYTYRKIKTTSINFIFILFFVYTLLLFWENHSAYTKLGSPASIQGRYILFLIPYILGVFVLAFSHLSNSRLVKLLLFALLICVLTQGGGVISYITKSDSRWYWDNEVVLRANNEAKVIFNKTTVLE